VLASHGGAGMRTGVDPAKANVMATVAVFVALGGTSYAVATGSIDSRELTDARLTLAKDDQRS
jgi:hypothetical protein